MANLRSITILTLFLVAAVGLVSSADKHEAMKKLALTKPLSDQPPVIYILLRNVIANLEPWLKCMEKTPHGYSAHEVQELRTFIVDHKAAENIVKDIPEIQEWLRPLNDDIKALALFHELVGKKDAAIACLTTAKKPKRR